MNVKWKVLSSIGGINLVLREDGKSTGERMSVSLPDDILDDLIIESLRRRYHDLSPKVLEACAEIAAESGARPGSKPKPTTLDKIQSFIRFCENEHGESKRDGETDAQYLTRLRSNYTMGA